MKLYFVLKNRIKVNSIIKLQEKNLNVTYKIKNIKIKRKQNKRWNPNWYFNTECENCVKETVFRSETSLYEIRNVVYYKKLSVVNKIRLILCNVKNLPLVHFYRKEYLKTQSKWSESKVSRLGFLLGRK